MKPVKMQTRTWKLIQAKLHLEYPPSYFIGYKMKNKLGFTVREHSAWVENTDFYKQMKDYQNAQDSTNPMDLLLLFPPERGRTRTEIHLDFYSENKRTMFLLKYSEELATDDKRY